ncbi:DAK2 domain-containing protein [Nocardia sp. NPDC005978]|uniref:DAK2 domain-containing protein n=1 Tax=Nocardia sp. NPDC005978 TaxID=3156725 RepID=UPI0033BFB781
MAVDATVWVHEFARLVLAHEAELTDLDAAIGDADHGTNLRRGLAAAVAELDESTPGTAAGVYRHTAMTLIRAVGGAAGPLYGTFFLRLGAADSEGADNGGSGGPRAAAAAGGASTDVQGGTTDSSATDSGTRDTGAVAPGTTESSTAGFARAFRAGVEGVIARGKAAAGDKTMLDALLPAAAALDELAAAGATEAEALAAATEAAESGCAATIPMVARKGRASYLGERSAGHQDPGATSAVLLVRAARGAVR